MPRQRLALNARLATKSGKWMTKAYCVGQGSPPQAISLLIHIAALYDLWLARVIGEEPMHAWEPRISVFLATCCSIRRSIYWRSQDFSWMRYSSASPLNFHRRQPKKQFKCKIWSSGYDTYGYGAGADRGAGNHDDLILASACIE
jgi:hypothetical protein